MGPRPYQSQHASFLSTANRWQCGDTDGTEICRGKQEQCSPAFTVILKTLQRLKYSLLLFHSHKNMHVTSSASPEQARHGVPCNVVQRSVVLVGFPVGRVGIQSISELLVALIQLAG